MRSAIAAARNLGIGFTMACNTDMADKENYVIDCKEYGIKLEHIDFDRNPLNPKNLNAKNQLLKLMENGKYDIVHCNTPIGGLLGRLCAHRARVKHVIYQAHGFHFWKGAPFKNWVLYYPVELWLSKYTDILITITKEDYEIAKRMHAKKCTYVHGVGIDLRKFSRKANNDKNYTLREKLEIPENATVLLSVGELNDNKNHEAVIRALAELHYDNIYYIICGDGSLKTHYEYLAKELHLSERVLLVGFCENMYDYYRMADLFVFPSLREGIPASVMEAIATGIPVVASDIRGISDLVLDDKYRFDPRNFTQLSKVIQDALINYPYNKIEENYKNLLYYKYDAVVSEMQTIYASLR